MRTKGIEEIYYENGSVFVKRSDKCDIIIHPGGMGEVLEIDETEDISRQVAAATGRVEKRKEKAGPKRREFTGVLKK